MRGIILVAALALAEVALAQTPPKVSVLPKPSTPSTKLSTSEKLAPRASLLTGTAAFGSAKGLYVVIFPPPNQCVSFHPIPIHAESRAMALYAYVSRGGFSLRPSEAGLSVWTIEEWDDWQKIVPKEFMDEMNRTCGGTK